MNIPSQNAFLHAIIQHYYVDGQDGVLTPVGMLGNKLEADYHIVHGIRTRVQNTIRCIKEVPLEVEDVVLNSLASAQVVVSQNQKNLGVLVIDIGGGTMDYLAVRRWRDQAERRVRPSAATISPTTSAWGCAFRSAAPNA